MQIPFVRHRPWKPSRKAPWREPRPQWWIPAFVDLIGGAYVHWVLGLDRVVVRGGGALGEALKGTRDRGDRLVMVFRHCGDADPQGLWYALNTVAKAHYRALKPGPRPRFLFLASAEIALWGGPLARWALRASGALPLAHGVGSRPALDHLRRHLRESADPVVLAPEGQITYELLGPIVLDPGAANMALWAAEAAPGEARVMPLGVRYRCPRETWPRWSQFVVHLEKGLGLSPWSDPAGVEASAGRRLGRLWDHLLDVGEAYYRNHHHRDLPALASRQERCTRLFRVSIDLAAAVRGIRVGDDYRTALFHLRSAAMDLVFPRHHDRSPLGAFLEARGAAEGWWMNRHQDLADVLQGLSPGPDEPTLERAVEAVLNLADLAGRLAGGHVADRPRYFRRVLEITVGESWVVERNQGRSHRARAAEVTARIKEAFERLARDPA